MRKILVAIAVATTPGLWSVPAAAGGFATARFGGEHGHPMTANPTAIYYNPAGIARSTGVNIFLDGTVALRGVSYAHQPAPSDTPEPPDALGANNGEASTVDVLGSPMLGATAKIDGDPVGVAFGAAFFVPFGGMIAWPKVDEFEDHPRFPGIVDGVQRWYSIHGSIRSMYVAGTAAIAIVERVYVGASGNAVFSTVDSIRAKNPDGSNNIETEGRSWLDATGWHGSFGVGLLVEAIDDELLIGFSYQAPPGIDGMTLQGELKNSFAGSVTPDDRARAELQQELPDIFRLGVSYRPARELELRLFGDYMRWSLMERQCIVRYNELTGEYQPCSLDERGGEDQPGTVILNLPREWNDSFGIRAGLSYWLEPEIELFSGMGYDSNAIPDATLDPALQDFHDITASLGARFELAEFLHAAASYTHFFYFPRNTAGEARQATDYDGVSRGPDAGGAYHSWVGALNVNLQGSFEP